MEPGSSPTNPKLVSDSGPSFTLRSMANGKAWSCTPSGQQNGTFAGSCQAADDAAAATPATEFTFDTKLNLLEISQHWECSGS